MQRKFFKQIRFAQKLRVYFTQIFAQKFTSQKKLNYTCTMYGRVDLALK